MKKIILLLFLAAAGGYWLLLSRPGLYYDKPLEYRSFTLRARGVLPENPEAVLDKVYEKVSASELFNSEKKMTIYLPGSRGEFSFFTPLQQGECVRVNPLNGGIFLAAADFAADKACGDKALNVEITAGAARELARRAVKPLTYLAMKEWKLRGYAEKLSGGTGSFKPADICAGKTADPALQDYKSGLAVDFAMREEGISFSVLLNKDASYERVESGLKSMHCGR